MTLIHGRLLCVYCTVKWILFRTKHCFKPTDIFRRIKSFGLGSAGSLWRARCRWIVERFLRWVWVGKKKILMTRVFQHIVYVGIHRDYLPWTEWEGSDGNSAVFIYIIWNVIRQTEGFWPSVYNNRRTHNIHAYSYCGRQNARPIVNNREMFISVAARFAMALVKGNTLVSEIKRRFVNYFRFDKVSLWYITAFKTMAYVLRRTYVLRHIIRISVKFCCCASVRYCAHR